MKARFTVTTVLVQCVHIKNSRAIFAFGKVHFGPVWRHMYTILLWYLAPNLFLNYFSVVLANCCSRIVRQRGNHFVLYWINCSECFRRPLSFHKVDTEIRLLSFQKLKKKVFLLDWVNLQKFSIGRNDFCVYCQYGSIKPLNISAS
jgi:hypothetical protein